MTEIGDPFAPSPLDPEVPIPNFRRVTAWLFRGGQPDVDGIKALSAMGIKTVINLRFGKRAVNLERKLVEAVGIHFVSLPLNYCFSPSEESIARYFAILADENARPIFLHCLHGKDRTGLLIAMFRVAKEGWKVEDAYREMKACGFHHFSVRAFKWMLFRFARKLAKSSTN